MADTTTKNKHVPNGVIEGYASDGIEDRAN
jgi:hypothetical protein